MYCDRHEFEHDRGQRCGLLAGHDEPCADAASIVCPGCGVQGLALIHACPAYQQLWRRTEWFMLAFGGWGRCRPPDHMKEVLTWTDEGMWMDDWQDERSLERLPRRSWDEPTDPG